MGWDLPLAALAIFINENRESLKILFLGHKNGALAWSDHASRTGKESRDVADVPDDGQGASSFSLTVRDAAVRRTVPTTLHTAMPPYVCPQQSGDVAKGSRTPVGQGWGSGERGGAGKHYG